MSETQQIGAGLAHKFNQANADFRSGRWQEALGGFEAALAMQPDLEAACIQIGRCRANLGDWRGADDAYAQALVLNPLGYTQWLERGNTSRRLGLAAAAERCYRRAIDVAPGRHEAPLALCRLLEEASRLDEADIAFQKAVEAAQLNAPDKVPFVYAMIARFRLDQKQPQRALDALDKGIVIAARNNASHDELCEWQLDRGNALMLLGRSAEAFKALTAASHSTRGQTLSRLAVISYVHNLWSEAGDTIQRWVDLYPQDPDALLALGRHLSECWKLAEARQVLDRLEQLHPHIDTRQVRGSMEVRGGDAEAALEYLIADARLHHTGGRECARVAMTSLYCDSHDAASILDLHQWLFEPLRAHERARSSFVRPARDGRRLRVGFIAADMHYQHPVNIFMQPILREFDRTRFECFVYMGGGMVDEQTRLAQARSEHWVEVETWTDEQLAARIDADQIDIVIDLLGHTAHSRGMMLGRRVAPVQVNYLGYPGTTGLPNMDWLISDHAVTPDGAEVYYSEKVARLPNTVFCYAPEEDFPLPAFDDSMAERELTFGSVNNAAKLSLKTLRLFAAVLDAVPGSRLSLRSPSFGDPQAVSLFQRHFTELGADIGRIALKPPVGMPDMMAAYADIDIVLDSHPYNGGTTTLQALWMGVPVITLEGQHFVSRMGVSFLRSAGLDDWIAADEEAYVATAVSKVADRKALLDLKRGLRARLQARPAWDPAVHTRNLEDAILAIMDASSISS